MVSVVFLIVIAHATLLVSSLMVPKKPWIFWSLQLPSILLCWIAYGAYETVYIPAHCSGDCSIRIDLVLIVPYLLFVTACFVIYLFREEKPVGNDG